jgi:hypothetical protein
LPDDLVRASGVPVDDTVGVRAVANVEVNAPVTGLPKGSGPSGRPSVSLPFITANVELLTARALKPARFGVALPLTPLAVTSEYHTPSLWPLGCRLFTV